MGLSPTAGLTPLVPSRKSAYGDKAKPLALRPCRRLCYLRRPLSYDYRWRQSQLRGDNLPLFLKLVSTARILPNVLVSVKLAVLITSVLVRSNKENLTEFRLPAGATLRAANRTDHAGRRATYYASPRRSPPLRHRVWRTGSPRLPQAADGAGDCLATQ